MNFFSGGRPQIRLVGLMLGIALIGLALGGAVWLRSALPRIEERRRFAANHQAEARRWRQVPGWIDDPCLFARRDPNVAGVYGRNHDVLHPHVYSLCLYWFPQGEAQHDLVRRHRDEILALCRERVAFHERMRDRWRFAAWTPWSDPGPDEPEPPIHAGIVANPSY